MFVIFEKKKTKGKKLPNNYVIEAHVKIIILAEMISSNSKPDPREISNKPGI